LARDSIIAQAMNKLSPRQRANGYALCEHLLLELEEHSPQGNPRGQTRRRFKNTQ